MAKKYLRPKQVAERYSVTVSTVWRWAREERFAHLNFPKAVPIGPSAMAFDSDELDAYDARRTAMRDGAAAA